MNRKRKMLIAIVLVAAMLLNCVMPIVQVGAATDAKITFEGNLYTAVKNELIRQNADAAYIDEQRTIIISADEIAKVTELSLSNSKLTDLTGLEVFTNLTILDLSSNELDSNSNLDVLNTFKLSTLDLSSNAIDDVSMITNLDNIPNLNLHNQKLNIVHIVELDTTNASDQITEVTYALPQILSRAGYLETEWLVEERTGLAHINWSNFDQRNIKVKVAEKTDSTYTPYKSMVTLRIRISDSTNTLYNSDINMFFVVVDSNERGIHLPDKNLYNAIKTQLTSGQSTNSDLISYVYTSPSSLRRTLYERAYAEPQVLVISIDDIINRIGSLKLSNKKIEKLDGIEKFVGLETELDLSGNYIKSIDKLIELQENQIIEEEKLRERVSAQLDLVSETLSKIEDVESSITAENLVLEALLKTKRELENKCEELETALANLRNKKAELEAGKETLEEELTLLENKMQHLKTVLDLLEANLESEKTNLNTLKDEKNVLENELAQLKEDLTVAQANVDKIKADITAKEAEIAQKESAITAKQADIANKQAEVDSKIDEISKKQQDIDSKTTTIAIYDTQISDVNIRIAEIEMELAKTQEQLNQSSFESMITSEDKMNQKIEDFMNDIDAIVDADSKLTSIDKDVIKSQTRGTITSFIQNAYNPINEQIEVISGLVVNTKTTAEELNSAIKKLYDNVINNSINWVDNAEIDVDISGYTTDSATPTNLQDKIEEFRTSVELDLNVKKLTANDFAALVNELHEEFKAQVTESTTHLIEEKSRLQNEINNLKLEIEDEDTGLQYAINLLELELEVLKAERDTLIAEKESLEDDLVNLNNDLEQLKEDLVAAENSDEIKNLKIRIAEKETEITGKQTEIDAKQREIDTIQDSIEKQQKDIDEQQKLIEEKQAEITKKEQEIQAKEQEIQAKIAEIAAIVAQLNAQEESIAQSELKLAELYRQLEKLNEVLLSRMSRLYQIYNRVDKLASFATSDLKTITSEEFSNLTYNEAKAMFEKQINKIAEIENDLIGFEVNYLIDKYDIPTYISTEVEKTIQNEDGTTSKITTTVTEVIENPISTYFNDLAQATEEWNLSDFKAYLTSFREDDTYFSMVTYCYLVRLFDGITTCQATKYIDIEIKRYEFDEEPTTYLQNAKNNFATIINQYNYNCSGTPSASMLKDIASRMVKARSDIEVYVYLPRLKSVNVNENLIENIDRISELTELRRFYAYDNEIVDISKVDWASMTKLKVLNLGFNGISNTTPLEDLTNLEELYLQKNLISGSFDFNMYKLVKLRVLDLSENQIDDIEKLIKYLTYEARAYGYSDVATFLRYSGRYDIRFNNQQLSITVDKKFEVNENRKVELPKIFRQIEEIDYANTSFGIDSLGGNVTSDGKEAILDTRNEGTHKAVVSIINTKTTPSLGSGTTCTITYTVGNIEPIKVTITPETASVVLGKTQQFTADVTGEYVTYKGVTWEVTGATSANTNISEDGLLTVGADETAESLIVKATSLYDETKAAEVQVIVIKKQVTSIKLTPETTTVFKGESAEFTVTVEGENLEATDKEVKWGVLVQKTTDANGNEVVPTPAEGTTASYTNNKLKLTVGPKEKISTFVIEATSTFDETKVARAVVTVDERIVSEVKITPETATVEKGKTQAFTATVNGEDLRTEDKKVTYKVTGNTSDNTKITNEGLLTVGSDEKSTTIKVVAVSNYDNTKSAEAIVTVTSKQVFGYTIENEYIVGVATKTPVNDFKTNLTEDYTVIVKEDGKEVKTGYMKTGMYVELRDENGNTVKDENGLPLVYEVVVKGDVNSDGVADAIDSNLIKALRNEVITLDEVQVRAADIDDSNEVDLLDSKLLLYHRAEVKDYCLDYTK